MTLDHFVTLYNIAKKESIKAAMRYDVEETRERSIAQPLVLGLAGTAGTWMLTSLAPDGNLSFYQRFANIDEMKTVLSVGIGAAAVQAYGTLMMYLSAIPSANAAPVRDDEAA